MLMLTIIVGWQYCIGCLAKHPNIVFQHLSDGIVGCLAKDPNIIGQHLLDSIVGFLANDPNIIGQHCWMALLDA